MAFQNYPRKLTAFSRKRAQRAWEMRYIELKTWTEIRHYFGRKSDSKLRMEVAVLERELFETVQGEWFGMKVRQTGQLENVAMAAMRAWEKSQVKKVVTRNRIDDTGRSFAETTEETRTGNPAYLRAAMMAWREIRMIWGLDAIPALGGQGTGDPMFSREAWLAADPETLELQAKVLDRLSQVMKLRDGEPIREVPGKTVGELVAGWPVGGGDNGAGGNGHGDGGQVGDLHAGQAGGNAGTAGDVAAGKTYPDLGSGADAGAQGGDAADDSGGAGSAREKHDD